MIVLLTHDGEHDKRRAGDGDGVRYLAHHRRLNVQTHGNINQISIKTPNPKWCPVSRPSPPPKCTDAWEHWTKDL